MKENKFKKKINILELHKLKKYSLNNNSINLIDVECKKLNKNDYEYRRIAKKCRKSSG